MPIVTGDENILNADPNRPAGLRFDTTEDADYNAVAFVQELNGDVREIYAFFLLSNGQLSPKYLVGRDVDLLVEQSLEGRFRLFAADGDYARNPPVTIESDGTVGPAFPEDVEDSPPTRILTADGLFSIRTGAPVGADSTDGTYATVYTAPDGDGTGVFLRLIDDEGHRVGGVIRLNDEIAGDQSAPVVTGQFDAYFAAWTQSRDEGTGLEEYRSKAFYPAEGNLQLAIQARAGDQTMSGDIGDYQTDIFLFDTAAGQSLGRDRIEAFGINDILVTTSAIRDSNGDGIVTFGGDRLLDLIDANGRPVSQIAMPGVRSLEFDGSIDRGDGTIYYVYSRVGTEADEYYLMV